MNINFTSKYRFFILINLDFLFTDAGWEKLKPKFKLDFLVIVRLVRLHLWLNFFFGLCSQICRFEMPRATFLFWFENFLIYWIWPRYFVYRTPYLILYFLSYSHFDLDLQCQLCYQIYFPWFWFILIVMAYISSSINFHFCNFDFPIIFNASQEFLLCLSILYTASFSSSIQWLIPTLILPSWSSNDLYCAQKLPSSKEAAGSPFSSSFLFLHELANHCSLSPYHYSPVPSVTASKEDCRT